MCHYHVCRTPSKCRLIASCFLWRYMLYSLSYCTIPTTNFIPKGIFASPTTIAQQVNSVGASLIVWAGCGVIAMFGSLAYTELGTMYPNSSGGEYIYIKKAFGDLPAFLFTFTSVFITKPATMTLIALTCGDYLMEAVGGDPKYSKLVAFVLLGKFNISKAYWLPDVSLSDGSVAIREG